MAQKNSFPAFSFLTANAIPLVGNVLSAIAIPSIRGGAIGAGTWSAMPLGMLAGGVLTE